MAAVNVVGQYGNNKKGTHMSWNLIPTKSELREVFGDSDTPETDQAEDYGLPLVDIGRGLKACAATVTPKLAEEMLANRHGKNRKVEKNKVQKYAEDMRHGAWSLNGETIVFDVTGRLHDCHHRLEACVLSGEPFSTVVVRVPDEDAIFTIDQGRSRSVNQALKMIDGAIPESATLAALWNHLAGRKLTGGGGAGVLTPAEALAFQKELPELQKSIEMGKAVARRLGGSYSAYAALHYLGSQTMYSADFFFERLATGAELPEGSPILALREWLKDKKDNKAVGQVLRMHVPWQFIIRAWNSWVREESVSYMKGSAVWHDMRGLPPKWQFGARKQDI